MTELSSMQRALLDWFAEHGRDLPWRRTRDPYRILVSEIMLQQTQVDRVMPKYAAFLELFPTAEALAAAPTADVIKAWQGLGYNRRAVNLQRAAQAVVAAGYPGDAAAFPDTPEGLRGLPGIGAYTAGAVACFAFERDVAFLDTNIRRVVRRALAGPEDQPPETPEAALVALAAGLVPPGRGWAWNQAIMELGATICTAARPQCWRCPLRDSCAAYRAWSAADSNASLLEWAPPVAKVRRKAAEQPFHSSNRFFRGRVIDALRGLADDAAHTLAELGPLVKEEWSAAELPWLAKLAQGLAVDGLLVWREQPGDDLAAWSVALPR